VKITELVDDGTAVKEGDVVARFDPVWLQRASQDMEEARKKAEAEAAQSAVALATELSDLQAKAAQKEVEAARAAKELEKKTVVSDNQYKLSVIDSEIAAFEARAAARQVEALADKMRTENGFHSANVEARRYYEQRIAKIATRFETRAPHNGVVRHLFLPREKRKVQKGDSPNSAMPFVAVARDEKLSVRFYVPERSLGDFLEGTHVLAVSRFADKPFPGVVRKLSSFPQELGLAKNNNDLPNAREIIYVAIADLEPQPEGLSAGLEVEVRRP
jgi:multidrug efflux pump subunit AcrA (membrane-fusion protein)